MPAQNQSALSSSLLPYDILFIALHDHLAMCEGPYKYVANPILQHISNDLCMVQCVLLSRSICRSLVYGNNVFYLLGYFEEKMVS